MLNYRKQSTITCGLFSSGCFSETLSGSGAGKGFCDFMDILTPALTHILAVAVDCT